MIPPVTLGWILLLYFLLGLKVDIVLVVLNLHCAFYPSLKWQDYLGLLFTVNMGHLA